MKVVLLHIENFVALERLELDSLPSSLVLAGPNGCGKSCVLDALRLLKSAYGSYQQDEWNAYFSERQIDLNRDSSELLSLFHDRTKEIVISARFQFTDEELQHLSTNAIELIGEMLVRENESEPGVRRKLGPGASKTREIKNEAARRAERVRAHCDTREHDATLTIRAGEPAALKENELLQLVFSTYQPQVVGVLDYHGANRTYGRQRVSNINLTIESSEQRNRPHALYNYANKYANIKTEMGSAYVRHLLTSKAVPDGPDDDVLIATLKELFQTFFPGKEFLGPTPTSDGKLLFPVRLDSGAQHDIDDLSSGEKEVLFGYLRLHNSAPRNSIIMIDEPELHLNPRLVAGLAAFYHKHLGERLGNQLWLVTHSDTLIREAVEHPAYNVFHVHPTGRTGENQASEVSASEDIDSVVLSLVGDLAAYRPRAKIVIFESTEDANFDADVAKALFPDFASAVNTIAAGNKAMVRRLHSLLEAASRVGHVPGRFYSIADRDGDYGTNGPSERSFTWDVYHIENYLLEPKYILAATRRLGQSSLNIGGEREVLAALKQCAAKVFQSQLEHDATGEVNRQLTRMVEVKCDPKGADLSAKLTAALERVRQRSELTIQHLIDQGQLESIINEKRERYAAAMLDDSWLQLVRGRETLKAFVERFVQKTGYKPFRSLLLAEMVDDGYQPPGMKRVLDKILIDE